MSLLARIISALLLSAALHSIALARDDTAAPGVQTIVPFASTEGLDRLARSTAKSDFAILANQFEAQATIAFCGPATAAIVLNALQPPGLAAPGDRCRLKPADARHLPSGLQLTIPRHAQESVIARGKKQEPKSLANPPRSMARFYVMAATSYANSTKCSGHIPWRRVWSSSMPRQPRPPFAMT